MERGLSLEKYVAAMAPSSWPLLHFVGMLKDALAGLEHLHTMQPYPTVHMDVRPRTIIAVLGNDGRPTFKVLHACVNVATWTGGGVSE
jgi:hypothetical protein